MYALNEQKKFFNWQAIPVQCTVYIIRESGSKKILKIESIKYINSPLQTTA